MLLMTADVLRHVVKDQRALTKNNLQHEIAAEETKPRLLRASDDADWLSRLIAECFPFRQHIAPLCHPFQHFA